MEKGCGKFSGFVRKPVENTLGGLKNPGNMREKFSTDFLAHVENLFCGPWNVPLSRDVFLLPLGQGEHPEAEQEHPRPGCSSPSWRTTSRPTAACASPRHCGPTWAARTPSANSNTEKDRPGRLSFFAGKKRKKEFPHGGGTPWKKVVESFPGLCENLWKTRWEA